MKKEKFGILIQMLPEYWKTTIKIPTEQREGKIWTLEQKQLLIDSIYNDYDIPKVYFRRTSEKLDIWYLVDGQQRIGTILEFLYNKFSLSKNITTLPERIWGKTYRQLSPEDKGRVGTYNLDAVLFTPEASDEEEDMFLRLNNGTPLSAAEKRNAIRGEFCDSVKKIAEHRFFKHKVNFPNKRFSHDAVAAQLSTLALFGGPTSLKGTDLKKTYIQKRTYPECRNIETKVKKILNLMDRVFRKQEPFMKKFYVISIFALLQYLEENYSLNGITPQKIYDFFEDFERTRYLNTDLSEEDSNFNPELFEFYEKTVNSPDGDDSVKTRHTILAKYFLARFPEIEPKDRSRRLFSEEQKLTIYYLARGICANVKGFPCPNQKKKLSMGLGEFDHKKEWNRGGRTIVSNGQFLCRPCHQYKTSLSR